MAELLSASCESTSKDMDVTASLISALAQHTSDIPSPTTLAPHTYLQGINKGNLS